MASDASQDIPQLMSRSQHTLDAARILLEKEFFQTQSPDLIMLLFMQRPPCYIRKESLPQNIQR